MKKKQEDLRGVDEEHAAAWMVRGEQGVKRRLAELIYEATKDIFAICGYPPKYLLSAKTALKAVAKRGVSVRPVCMIRPMQSIDEALVGDATVIEYRSVKAFSTLKVRIQPHDEKLLGGFRGMPGEGAMVIIDESMAFDIVDDGSDPKKAAGILIKAPGIPPIQKATVERILALYTRKL